MRKFSLLTALLLAAASPVLAQPPMGGAPMARGAQNPQPGGPDWAKMTPEERQKAIRKIIEDTVRGSLTHLGYTDAATQNAVVAAALAEEDSLGPVREAHRKLLMSLMLNPKSDKETAVLMTDLRDAIAEAKAERAIRIKALDVQIEFSKKPGLNAFLSILGVTGDESAYMGGVTGSFTGAMANMTRQLG